MVLNTLVSRGLVNKKYENDKKLGIWICLPGLAKPTLTEYAKIEESLCVAF